MADKSTTYAFEDLIKDNSVNITELSPKTQELINKFKTLTDEDSKDAMDEKIYGQIEDHLEAKQKTAKEAKTKEKVKEVKAQKKTLDVSQAATAKIETTTEPEKPKSSLGFLFGK